ncbi:SDR family oxidoreductase [Methylocapsa palsarum]|uniref:Short-chain dehydrogenase n=1 Tax=Methylocapsa palsarum TaxID=1612308 RepID=A0A1I3YDU9_9HYPH|nr:SDR family oxidoreductase [Methylocapsa palsarum]SFK29992.1 Short-chain dehydrogenase [Methylocapsa palsarum]
MPRSALVIGASRGLGLGLVRELASRGWRVTPTVRDRAKAASLVQLEKDNPTGIRIETLDVNDANAVETLAARLAGQKFDLIFLNAGIFGPAHQSVDEATAEDIGRLVYTNSIAPVKIAKRFSAQVAPGGTIAFMTSQLGSVAGNTSGGYDLYRASKAALNTLTRSFAITLKDTGVTVLSIHPGWVRTDMGGDAAPLDVATSATGIVDVIEARWGSKSHAYLNYKGEDLPW